MLLRILLAASLALLSSAAPAPATSYDWSPQLAAFYSEVSKRIANVKSTPAFKNDAFSCDMSKAQVNFPSAPTALPSLTNGATLKHVILGVGTQNYTCASKASTTTPAAAGAYAQLFNVSCIAANYPEILATLPGLALQYQLPSQFFPPPGTVGQDATETPGPNYSYQPLNVVYSGLHTFADLTTARFNLDLSTPSGAKNGFVLAKKFASTPAWPNATAGQYGTVPYLRLDTIDGTRGGYTNLFRMQTAGGAGPKDCQANEGLFTQQYAATYWLYGH